MARLENHLTFDEITTRSNLLYNPRITPSNQTVIEEITEPKVGIRDVYEKVVYDTVRRDRKRTTKLIYLGNKQSNRYYIYM